MPLSKADLESNLRDLFESPPDTAEACAAAWGDALEAHSIGIIPASTTVTAAADVLAATLSTLFATATPVANAETFAAAMELAFATFATTVGTGMSPAYTATPPSGNIGFSTLFSVTKETAEEAAADFATVIHGWMIMGTATQTTTPFTTVNWS